MTVTNRFLHLVFLSLILMVMRISAFGFHSFGLNTFKHQSIKYNSNNNHLFMSSETSFVGATATSNQVMVGSLSTFGTDIMGNVNFCLASTDISLSGPSRTRILNEFTNDVFKSIAIGFEPLIEEVSL